MDGILCWMVSIPFGGNLRRKNALLDIPKGRSKFNPKNEQHENTLIRWTAYLKSEVIIIREKEAFKFTEITALWFPFIVCTLPVFSWYFHFFVPNLECLFGSFGMQNESMCVYIYIYLYIYIVVSFSCAIHATCFLLTGTVHVPFVSCHRSIVPFSCLFSMMNGVSMFLCFLSFLMCFPVFIAFF